MSGVLVARPQHGTNQVLLGLVVDGRKDEQR
jgi:hypothetical protein